MNELETVIEKVVEKIGENHIGYYRDPDFAGIVQDEVVCSDEIQAALDEAVLRVIQSEKMQKHFGEVKSDTDDYEEELRDPEAWYATPY